MELGEPCQILVAAEGGDMKKLHKPNTSMIPSLSVGPEWNISFWP